MMARDESQDLSRKTTNSSNFHSTRVRIINARAIFIFTIRAYIYRLRRLLTSVWCIVISSIKSLYNFKNLLQRQLTRYLRQWLSRFLSHCVSGLLLMNKILLNESLTIWLLRKRRHSVYRGLLKPNRICRLIVSETLELSMEEIHRHVRQFVHGKKNLQRQGQCSIKEGRPRTSEENIDRIRNRVSSWCASYDSLMMPIQRCIKWGKKKNWNIYVSFCNNFHLSVFSLASVINFWNCKETLRTPCTRLSSNHTKHESI